MIRELNREFEIALNLKDFGIIEEEFKEKIAEISKNAVADACTGTNPCLLYTSRCV